MNCCACGYSCVSQMARHRRTCKVLRSQRQTETTERMQKLSDENTKLREENACLRTEIACLRTETACLRECLREGNTRFRKELSGPARPKMLPQRRLRLAAKQAWKCNLCDATLDEAFHVDHIQPWAETFNDDDSNLQVLCPPCHLAKTSEENSAR